MTIPPHLLGEAYLKIGLLGLVTFSVYAAIFALMELSTSAYALARGFSKIVFPVFHFLGVTFENLLISPIFRREAFKVVYVSVGITPSARHEKYV